RDGPAREDGRPQRAPREAEVAVPGEGHEDVGEREEDRGAEHGAGGGGGPSKVSRARGRASLKIAPGGSGGQSPPPPTALRSVADPGPLPLQQPLVEAPRL